MSNKTLVALVVLPVVLAAGAFWLGGYFGLGHPQHQQLGVTASPIINPILNGASSSTDGSSHTIIAAQGAGLRSYINVIVVANTSSTNTYVTITDGTSTFYIPAPANSGAVVSLPATSPFQSVANTAVTFQAASGVSTIYVSAQGYQSQ